MNEGEGGERSTGELIETLGDDYNRCYRGVLERLDSAERLADGTKLADTDFEARQLVRAAFAYIEGAIFALKVEASFNGEETGRPLTWQQEQFVFEVDFDLNNRGEVSSRPAKIPLDKNIRFAFLTFAAANGIDYRPDFEGQWWSSLMSSIRVRDRLTHPRTPMSLDVTPKEIVELVSAVNGFNSELMGLLSKRDA